MTTLLRLVAMIAGAGILWLVAASDLYRPARLPVDAVVVGATVTQPFGCTWLELEPYAPFCPGRHLHTGIDLAAPAGSEVHSATSGVARVGFDPGGAGLFVAVQVDPRARVIYCHLSGFNVLNGDAVQPGQVIGWLGSTGNSTGPHVHFEVQVDGHAVDPEVWLADGN